MPIYEYKCEDCGETFEVIQKISENKNKFHCPDKNVVVFEEKTKSHTNTGGAAPVFPS